MIKSIEELKAVDVPVSGIVNGVDSPNLLSVDSTTPIQTEVDELTTEESAEEEVKEPEKKVDEEEKEEVDEEKESEKAESKEDEKIEAKTAKVPVKGSREKRIDILTKRWRTAERDLDYERTKRRETEAKLEQLQLTSTADKPKPEDYEDTPAFLEALTDWRIEQKMNLRQAKAAAETEEVDKKRVEDNTDDEIDVVTDKGREKYSDYDEFVFNEDLILTSSMLETVLLSDIPEEVLYYLGQNLEVAAEIGEMSAIKAARKIGKLEVEIAAGIPDPNTSSEEKEEEIPTKKLVKSTHKKLTKAPAPITPVKVTGVTEQDPAKMSLKEYRVWRESHKE